MLYVTKFPPNETIRSGLIIFRDALQAQFILLRRNEVTPYGRYSRAEKKNYIIENLEILFIYTYDQ